VNLREGAALPFSFLQNLFLVKVLRGGGGKDEERSWWWVEVFYLAMVTGESQWGFRRRLDGKGSQKGILKFEI
jgi:hypothetical protein